MMRIRPNGVNLLKTKAGANYTVVFGDASTMSGRVPTVVAALRQCNAIAKNRHGKVPNEPFSYVVSAYVTDGGELLHYRYSYIDKEFI
jgi:hypothetical protein